MPYKPDFRAKLLCTNKSVKLILCTNPIKAPVITIIILQPPPIPAPTIHTHTTKKHWKSPVVIGKRQGTNLEHIDQFRHTAYDCTEAVHAI